MNQPEDVFRRVAVSADDECWPWRGSVSSSGYGQFYVDGALRTAHRLAYEVKVGPIPEGLEIDHLCRNRRCCNPAHLEPVTGKENVNRSPIHHANKTHCPQGHEYTPDNTTINKTSKGRVCRECMNADSRERKRQRRQAFVEQGLTTRGTPRIYKVPTQQGT